jgi:hypothetical protein
MAAPTAPTLSTIAAEGLKKAGYDDPSSALTTRAESTWMEEIKNDIWAIIKNAKMLEETAWVTAEKGEIYHDFPADMQELKTAKLLYGSVTGTAQAGTDTSITLASAYSSAGDYLYGKPIYIYGGTGSEQARIITAWNNSTKVATIHLTWGTNPDATSTYMIVDTYYRMDVMTEWAYDKENYPFNKHRPISLVPIGDEDNGQFKLFNAPDDTYGVELRYYLDLMELDLASTRMSTLYKRWRNCWVYGVYAKCLESDDDDRSPQAMAAYNNYLRGIGGREAYGLNVSTLQQTVEDY